MNINCDRNSPEAQRLRSPTFFVNLKITFDSEEKVGDLGINYLGRQVTNLCCKSGCVEI